MTRIRRARAKSLEPTVKSLTSDQRGFAFQFWQFRRYRGPQTAPLSRGLGWDFGNLFHGPLPASLSHRPTPHKRFVENKSRTPIRPNGRPNGRSLFSRFSGLQSGSISALFSRFYCPVGRGSQCESRAAQAFQFEEMFPSVILFFTEKQRIERNAALANCQLLSANCLVVKDLPTSTPEGGHTLADSR